MTTLREQTTRAFKWSYISLAVNVLVLPLFAAILARLLTQQQFGVMASGNVLFALGYFIADMGMGAAIVQKAKLTKGNVRAAFTSSIVLGGSMTLVGWFLAPLAGYFFKDPEVVHVFRGFSLTYIALALSVVSVNLLRRKMNFKALVIAEIVSLLIGHGIFGLGAAKLGYGAFSLVISSFAQNVLLLIITFSVARFPVGLTFRWKDYKELYAFGTKSTVAGFADYMSQNVDALMIGHFYGVTVLGLYDRAFKIVCTPLMSFSRSASRVLESSMSAVQNDQAKLRRAYVLSVTTMSVLMFPVAFGIFICAPEIISVLLGKKFLAAVPVSMVLALYIPFPILSSLSSTLVTATAQLGARIRIQLGYLLLLTLAFLASHFLVGNLIGFAVVLALVSILRCLAYAVVVGRIIGGGMGISLRPYLTGMISGLAVAVPLWLATVLLRPHLPLPLMLISELLLGGGLMAAVLLFGPETELQDIVKRRLRPVLQRFQIRMGVKA
jgi:lipopolysaccharide exporter